ncbi:PfkB family carbohydrate kinase [Desulfovibrio inopinatus]|uniref:PfkB family carbohydrate kinase n=1 Tax=Desulfovibrio inopinatus TaxID=102109 RepID=UPI000423D936|nr:PfkB family carbohydrate kinase [Desulfovibrio inopinatus]
MPPTPHTTPCLIGLGEVLWDVLADHEEIGGAPINFAYHANALGAKGIPVSTIGNDARGRRALDELQKRHLATAAIAVDPDHPTGYVPATVDEHGVATYVFPDDVAWDHLRLNDQALTIAEQADVVCFGILAQRSAASRQAIHQFLDIAHHATVFFDINLRQHFYTQEHIETSLKRAHVLKLNDAEFPVLRAMFDLPENEHEGLTNLVKRFDLKLAALTRGAHGSLLVAPSDSNEHPGVATDVVDTIGAGDSFTASLALGLLLGHDLATINDHANRLAAFVCRSHGAMPTVPSSWKLL